MPAVLPHLPRPVLPWGPQGFLMCTAMWSGSRAFALLLSPQAWDAAPAYSVIRTWPLTANMWTAVLLAHSLGTVVALVFGRPTTQALTAFLGIFFWGVIAIGNALGVWVDLRIVSPSALFALLCAVGSGVSVIQLARPPHGPN